MPRPPVQNWGSSPYHLVDDILRSIETLGTYEGLVGFGEHLLKNPLIIGFFLLIFKVFWTFRQKVPEIKGHLVRSIKNPDEWNAALKEAKLKKKIVVCHFYAAWSPTCKAASRIFQKMSIDFIGGNTTFCRVDIKEVQSLKHTFNIESTPTFKILIAEEQIETMAGWSNEGLRCMMERNGCKKPAARPATADVSVVGASNKVEQVPEDKKTK